MTIETKVFINFADSERITLQTAAALLREIAWETDGISDEISEKCTKTYNFLRDLIDLEG